MRFAAEVVASVTKPKPRDCFVSRSFITMASSTSPNCPKCSFNISPDVFHPSAPTNIFVGQRSPSATGFIVTGTTTPPSTGLSYAATAASYAASAAASASGITASATAAATPAAVAPTVAAPFSPAFSTAAPSGAPAAMSANVSDWASASATAASTAPASPARSAAPASSARAPASVGASAMACGGGSHSLAICCNRRYGLLRWRQLVLSAASTAPSAVHPSAVHRAALGASATRVHGRSALRLWPLGSAQHRRLYRSNQTTLPLPASASRLCSHDAGARGPADGSAQINQTRL
mmetsp:Transcript_23054/g.77839  ORF Transcript_23054/g.77839 Transcript_23054/m.77839 type:complete len:294 (-) Transcript_23054:972-1853(-)